MKYKDFYFWMFKSPMKKVLTEKYGKEYAADNRAGNDAPIALSWVSELMPLFCELDEVMITKE